MRIEYLPPDILDPADLSRVEVLKVGSMLRAEDVSDGIDRLFGTGEFDNIRVEAERSGDGVLVRFVTVPVRYIGSVAIQGKVSDPPNRGELVSAPQIGRGNVFHDADLPEAVDFMQKLLVANGFYHASVTPEAENDSTGQQMFLTFTLKAGKRARYEMPVIHGDTKLATNTIVRATGWRIRFINRWRAVSAARTRNSLQGIVKKYVAADRLEARVEMEKLDYDNEKNRV